MRYGISLLALLFALSAGAAQMDAQGRGKGQAKQDGAKADHAKPTTAKGPKSTTTTKTTKKATPTTTGTEARAKGNPHKTTTPTTDVTPDTPTTTYVKNPKLDARLRTLLKLPEGTDISPLSAGFKSWGQFVAAAHVSNNLGIDFNQLKTAMTGLVPGATPTDPWVPSPTPTTKMSLGQAIQSLPRTTTPDDGTLTTSKVRSEVKKAEDAATADLRRTRGRS